MINKLPCFSFQVNALFTDEVVTYDQIKTWVFQPEMSSGSLDDWVVNINMIALVRLLKGSVEWHNKCI